MSHIYTGSMLTFQEGSRAPQMISKSHPKFSEIVDLVVTQKDYDAAYALVDLKSIVSRAILGSNISLTGNALYYKGEEVNGLIGQRILEMHRLGLSVDSLIAFLDNLMDNPSKRAVDELYGFLESSRLPITDDGHFLAYKAVTEDYKDIHSGTIDNSVGQVITMPRNKVADNKDVTCSHGLHFAAHGYAESFGGSSSRMMIMKINPRDVVSIPSDYNNEKGRCCGYTVLSEVSRDDTALVGAQVVNTGKTVDSKYSGWTRNTGHLPVDKYTRVHIWFDRDKKAPAKLGDGNPAGILRWGFNGSCGDIGHWKIADKQDEPKESYVPQADNYDDLNVFDTDGEFWGEAKEFPVNRRTSYSLERSSISTAGGKDYGKGWFFTAYAVKHDNLVFRKHNGEDFDYVTVAILGLWDIYTDKVVLGS